MTEYTLATAPVREDPKGPLWECKSSRCMMVMRRDDCRIGDDGEMICPKCGRQMRRYHPAYESIKQ
jgi:hypothetical protein